MEISAHVMEDYLISAFSIPMMYYIKDFWLAEMKNGESKGWGAQKTPFSLSAVSTWHCVESQQN